jgi:hypothetical protein
MAIATNTAKRIIPGTPIIGILYVKDVVRQPGSSGQLVTKMK